MKREYSVSELAARVGGEIIGDKDVRISAVADFAAAKSGDIAFVEDQKLFQSAFASQAACLIVAEQFANNFAGALILVKNPKLAFAQIAQLIYQPYFEAAQIHSTAQIALSADVRANLIGAFVVVGENTHIGENTRIYAGAKIGNNVKIGKLCSVHSNTVIYDDVTIGDNVTLHAGAIIGADGFGFVRGENEYVKFPQIGTVVIEDSVEIGANTCVDRAALGETRIGRGTKIDNLVQIAHNVQIGERVVIASQTGISGSTVIESDAVIGGQVGMGDHALVKSGAIIGSKAGVLPGKIVRAGIWWGVPVQPLDEYKRQNALVKALPRTRAAIDQMLNRISQLERKLGCEDEQE